MEDYPSLEDIFSPRLSNGLKKLEKPFAGIDSIPFLQILLRFPMEKATAEIETIPSMNQALPAFLLQIQAKKRKRKKNSLRLEAEKMAKHIFILL